MSKKTFFLLIDTETTTDSLVADFGALICDRKGNVHNQCAVLTAGIFTDYENHPLFCDPNKPIDSVWSLASRERRYKTYNAMVRAGSRMVASVNAINIWLGKAAAMYRPILTAYNLPFDRGKCQNTGIDLTFFTRSFCLWDASYTHWAHTKPYRKFALANHAFNPPTELSNMTIKTNAETMARFVLNSPTMPNEPHTALEDALFYELPILRKLCRRRPIKWLLNETESYDWRKMQVRDGYKPL